MVVCIGSAPARNIIERLEEFDSSAFRGMTGHKGGVKYREKFPNDRGANLYVAIAGNGHDTRVFTVERELKERYQAKYGSFPLCNIDEEPKSPS